MTCEELELSTHIRDFTTLFYVILRRESSEWLESSVESDLSMRFVIWNLGISLLRFCFLQTLFLVQEQVIKKRVHYVPVFVIRENKILISVIHDSLFFRTVSYAGFADCSSQYSHLTDTQSGSYQFVSSFVLVVL